MIDDPDYEFEIRPTLKEAVDVCRLAFPGMPISVQYIRTRGTSPKYVWPRQFVMAYLRTHEKKFSLTQIARMVGVSHHTTVLHGLRKAYERWGQQFFYELHAIGRADEDGTFKNGVGWIEQEKISREAAA